MNEVKVIINNIETVFHDDALNSAIQKAAFFLKEQDKDIFDE